MKRSYSRGWEDIFGKRPGKGVELPQRDWERIAADLGYTEPPQVLAADIHWPTTRALSIRQPWVEEIMLGGKRIEFRGRRTKVRGRIAIYASLGRYSREEETEYEGEVGFALSPLPRGKIIGTVELYDCIPNEKHDDYEWMLRDPMRLRQPIAPTAHPQPVWFYPFGRE